MKKKTLTAIALGAATVATGMASNVHADNVTVTKEEVGDQTKIITTTTKTEASQEKINQDKQAVSDQQKVVDQSKSDMESAQSTVNSDKSKVESAQSGVDSAKQTLDNAKSPQQAVANQESKVQDDQNRVNQDQTNINNTQNDIKNDQVNVAQDQQNINNASQKVSDDQNQLNQDQSKLDQAQQTLQNDQNKVNDTQNQLNKVNDQINNQGGNVPTTQVPQDYKDLLETGKTSNANQLFDDMEKASDQLTNSFVPSSDDNYKVDPNNLTQDQKNELNIYAAQVINGIRQQFGTTPVKTNEAIIDLADQVAKDYNSDNFNSQNMQDNGAGNGHDANALGNQNLNDNPYGITWTRGSQDTEFSECIGNVLNNFDYNNCTMNDLKKQILLGIDGDFYSDTDSNLKHAKAIAGLGGGTYVGTSVDKYGNVHFEFSNDYVEQPVKDAMNKTNVSIPSTSDLQNQKSSLENQLAQQKQQVANDQQTVNDLQNQVNADKEQIKNDTPTALQQKLEQDQKKLSDDQNKLNDLQKQLTQDQNQLSQDQTKFDELKKTQVSPEKIQKAQDAYNDAVKALNDAQSQMNKDSDTLAKAQQAYIDARNKLNELETILKNDEKTVTTVDIQWIKHPHTTAEMGNKVVLSSSHQNTSSAVTGHSVNTVSSTVSENNTVKASNEASSPVHADSVSEVKAAQATTVKSDDNSNVIYFTSEAPQGSVKKEAKQNTMPQMGDDNSKVTLWGEISLAMAGVLATLGLAKRKRHE